MLNVTIGGHPASYSTADGWRCNDGLAQRHLQAQADAESAAAEGAPISEEQALALAVREYGEERVQQVVDETPAPAPDAASSTAVASPAIELGQLSDLELPPPDETKSSRISAFLAGRASP